MQRERGLKRFGRVLDRFSDSFSRFSNHFSYRFIFGGEQFRAADVPPNKV